MPGWGESDEVSGVATQLVCAEVMHVQVIYLHAGQQQGHSVRSIARTKPAVSRLICRGKPWPTFIP